MTESQSLDLDPVQPIRKKWAAVGWGILGLFFLCSGVWSSFSEPNTGGAGVALGVMALLLAWLSYRGAAAIVSATLQKIFLILILVFAALNAIEELGRDPLFFGSFGVLAVLLLYVVLRSWGTGRTQARFQS